MKEFIVALDFYPDEKGFKTLVKKRNVPLSRYYYPLIPISEFSQHILKSVYDIDNHNLWKEADKLLKFIHDNPGRWFVHMKAWHSNAISPKVIEDEDIFKNYPRFYLAANGILIAHHKIVTRR